MFATCSWPSLCEQSELQCWRRNRRLCSANLRCKGDATPIFIFYLEHPKVMRRPSILLLFSERGTRHDRTRDEARPNVGRDAVERGTRRGRTWDETRSNVGRRSLSKIGNGLSATVFSSPHKDFHTHKKQKRQKDRA